VSTVLGLVAPIELTLPGLAGLAAGAFDLRVALMLLGLAPLGVLLCAPRSE
jgi:hypothetical protein